MIEMKPEEWTPVTLGSVTFDINERIDNPSQSGYERFVGLEHLISGDFTIRKWGNTKDVTSSMKLFKKGDVLFGRRNTYLRRASMADFDGVCSGDAYVLRSNPDYLIDRFLPLILNTSDIWDYANAHSAGGMSKRAKWRDLENYSFVLPSKGEQYRIAEILWAAEDVIVKNEQFVAEAERYKQLMMYELFHKGIGHNEFKSVKKIGIAPKEWDVIPLSDVAEVKSGVTLGRKINGKLISLPYLRVANVKDGYLDLSEIKEVEILESEKEKWLLEKDDILLTEGGDWDKVGRGTIWRGEIPNCIHQNHIFSIRVSTNKALPIYYYGSAEGHEYPDL